MTPPAQNQGTPDQSDSPANRDSPAGEAGQRAARPARVPVTVRPLTPEDYDQIIAINTQHYPDQSPWSAAHFDSHRKVFPRGQLVAEDPRTGRVVGYAASLIVDWDDYDFQHTWDEVTAGGMFTNHAPRTGKTLYGADVMVGPTLQGRGVGKAIYKARFDLCRSLGLRRIRAGARLVGYHRYAEQMSAEDYVIKVVNREVGDPTLSFQLKRGFRVIAVVPGYMRHDPKSQGYAAVIEWINHQVAQRGDYRRRDPKFGRPRKPRPDTGPGA